MFEKDNSALRVLRAVTRLTVYRPFLHNSGAVVVGRSLEPRLFVLWGWFRSIFGNLLQKRFAYNYFSPSKHQLKKVLTEAHGPWIVFERF